MRAAILSVGSELLRGDIVDTNAAFLAHELSELGFSVVRVEQLGDDLADLTATFARLLPQVELVVTSGGLGPTQDDLTRDALAAALGEEQYVDDRLLAELETRFAGLRRRMPERNRQQARLIPSAESIPNARGTAPGWLVRRDGTTVVTLPGPPGELVPMWGAEARPRLERLIDNTIVVRSLLTFGLGESSVEEKIADLIGSQPELTLATYAKVAGVEVHLTARGKTKTEAERLADQTLQWLHNRLGAAVFGTGGDTLSGAVGRLLARSQSKLAVMESCTGGLLSSLITDHPGSSDYFVGGIVTYAPEAKIAHGVDPEVLDRFGLYSGETATAMALAARRHFDVAIGLGVTGIAGTESLEGKPPGTCYVAVSLSDRQSVREIHRPGDRPTVKHFAALSALDLLRRELAAFVPVS